jgi:hypothetical protein
MSSKDVVEDSNDSTNEKDVVEDSNESINAKMPCSSATVQLKEDKMEVFHEGKMEEPCAQDAELSNQREPSSDATAMEIEVVSNYKILICMRRAYKSLYIC